MATSTNYVSAITRNVDKTQRLVSGWFTSLIQNDRQTYHRRRNRLLRALLIGVMGLMYQAHADTVVSNGRFTNVYVYPDPNKETWEEHLKNLRPDDWSAFT